MADKVLPSLCIAEIIKSYWDSQIRYPSSHPSTADLENICRKYLSCQSLGKAEN